MVEVLQIAVLVDKRTTVMFQKIDKFNWNPSIKRFSFLIILSHSKKKDLIKMYCRLESSARKTLVMMSHGCVKLMAKNFQKKICLYKYETNKRKESNKENTKIIIVKQHGHLLPNKIFNNQKAERK